MVALFERHSARIFKKRFFHRGIFRSKYPSGPLREMVQSHFPTVTMGKIPTPLLITSSDISTGGVYVFKSRYMEELGEPYVRDRDIPLHDAILASCAAPTYFDPVQVGRPLLADGGLWANNPSILAVTEAISKFGRLRRTDTYPVDWDGTLAQPLPSATFLGNRHRLGPYQARVLLSRPPGPVLYQHGQPDPGKQVRPAGP